MLADSIDTFTLGGAFEDTSSTELRESFLRWTIAYQRAISVYRIPETTNNYDKLIAMSHRDGALAGANYVLANIRNPRPIFNYTKTFENEIEFVKSMPFAKDGKNLKGAALAQERYNRMGYLKSLTECLEGIRRLAHIK